MEKPIFWFIMSPLDRMLRVVDSPIPTRTLKIGPAVQPVIAISGKPFLVMPTSAAMSPSELAHETMVRAKSASGKVVMKPKIWSRSMIVFEMKAIQMMDITKQNKALVVISL